MLKIEPNKGVLTQVIATLGFIGREATEVVPDLIRALDDPQVLVHALGALVRTGQPVPQAVPRLRKILQNEDPHLRHLAVVLLGRADENTIHSLIEDLRHHPDWRIREQLALAFGSMS